MTHFQTTAEKITLLQVSQAGLKDFEKDAQNPQVIANAKAAYDAKSGGFDTRKDRPEHGRDGFERTGP